MNGKPLRVWAASIIVLMVSLGACSSQPNAAPAPDPSVVLQALPPADSAQYEPIQDMKKWRNPYLIVRTDGVALFDTADMFPAPSYA